MSIAEFSIRNRLIMMIVITASLFGGLYAYQNMARFEDPEFTIRTAVVATQYPGASPEEVANEVTRPLEKAIQQMQEVEQITSTSTAGVSLINVDIKYRFSPSKSDLQAIWSKLRNKIDDAAIQLPPGVRPPSVNDDFGDVYGLYYLITGEGFSIREIEEYAKSLRDDLLQVDDVARVVLHGTADEAIHVAISRHRAATLGVSVAQIYDDLAQQNSVVSAGDVQVGTRRLLIQPSGGVDSVEAIRNLVVSTPSSGTVIYLRDIASVTREQVVPSPLEVRFNGQPAIGLGVSNVTGANVVKMGQGIDARLAETLVSRPIGIQVHEFYHQGRTVVASVNNFVANVLAALAIVLVTLLLFMGLRSAVTIGAVLILTVAATLAIMYLVGIPMHRISLGALIIALGMLVDNAIVVTEGILVGVRAGRHKTDIAKEIVHRSKWPLFGGTLVGIIAFAPIGLAPGSTAEYTGDLFRVIMISLLLSWVFALTIVPFLCDLLFRQEKTPTQPTQHSAISGRYRAFLRTALRAPAVPVIVAGGLFGLAMWGFGFTKSGFFPASATPQLVVDLWLPEGTDVSQTKANMLAIEPYLADLDGVADVQTLIGAGALRYMLIYSPETANSAYGQFLVRTTGHQVVASLVERIQTYLDDNLPDVQAKVWQFRLGPGGGSKIEAVFSGPDPVVLRRLASQAKAIMASDAQAGAVRDDWRQPVSVIVPQYSETRGRRLGVSREDMSIALQTNFSGRSIGVYREGDRLIPIIARAPENERRNVRQMASIQIPGSAAGETVPLIEVVDHVRTLWRDSILRRVDRAWTIKAQCDPVGGTLTSELFARLRPQIEAIDLPPGYHLEWGGEFGDSAEANSSLASTLPLGLVAMVLVVVLLFNSLRRATLIFLIVPLALVGVVAGLLLTGTALEFMAILALLSLSGLLIKNAIVLVDQTDQEIRDGKPRLDAAIDSAVSRVRPVMMGSLTTVLGVIPLFGDPFFRSMAVVLVFGLSFATVLTLLVVPALYTLFFRISPDETAHP